MPKPTKITDKVFARIELDLADGINAIHAKHQIEPAVLIRGLLKEAVAFYRAHGFFSFPVRIEPEAFQRQWLAAAEPGQAGYGATPIKIDHLAMAAAAERAADEELRKRARPKRPKHSPR